MRFRVTGLYIEKIPRIEKVVYYKQATLPISHFKDTWKRWVALAKTDKRFRKHQVDMAETMRGYVKSYLAKAKNIRREGDKLVRDVEHADYYIEINTLEELLLLQRELNEPIEISGDSLYIGSQED